MKQQDDQHHSERSFEVGDQIFLRLQPYNQTSLKPPSHQKLAPKFYGLYQVIQCIGPVTYKLALSTSSKIHLVFHVSCIKKVVGLKCTVQTTLPELDEEGSIWLELKAIKDIRESQLKHRMVKEVFVQWKDTTPEDAIWELASILQQFPHLQP